jgi:hypothetical protein
MAIYHAEYSIAGVNSVDGVLWNLKSASQDRVTLIEAGFFIEAAPSNAPQFGIKRMNAVGTGTITTATVAQSDASDGTSAATLETAWATTRPTVTGGSFLRGQAPTTVGNGIVFDFRAAPIIVPLSGGLCGIMRNAAGATVGTLGGWIKWTD